MMQLLKARAETFLQYRHLIRELVIKDIKLKYRRSFLGYFWSILNPLMIMAIMVIVFSNMFRFDIENFPVYLIIGQTLFNFLTESTTQSIFSITGNAALLKKTYVPKYAFTLSKVTETLPEYLRQMIMVYNPLYNYIFQFRMVVMYGSFPDAATILSGVMFAVFSVLIGSWCFLNTQDQFILYI